MKERLFTDRTKHRNNGSFLLANTRINMDKDGRLFRHRPPDSSSHKSAVFGYLRDKLACLWNFRNRYSSRKCQQ